VDFTNEALAHGRAAREVLADQLERPSVIEQLPNIVGKFPPHFAMAFAGFATGLRLVLDADWLHTELLVAGITRREFHTEIRDAAPAAPELSPVLPPDGIRT
jgi:hypothetical protein